MPDIPAASPVSSASSATTSPGNNIVVETTVNNVPDKIQALARQIEVTGTLAQSPAGNSVTLNTVIGPLTLLLPQMAQAQQDKLLQQLITLFQNQKPLTVVLQPGNPPSQAFLLLPPSTQASQYQTAVANFLAPSVPSQTAPSIAPNTILSAVVLPGGMPLSSAAPAQGGQIPYASLNPNLGSGVFVDPANAVSNAATGLPLVAPLETVISEEMLTIPMEQGLPNVPLPQAAQSPNVLASSDAPAAVLLQPGTELSLRINAVIAPSAQGATSIPSPQGNQILATVTGNAPGGQVILKAGDATLFVRQPVDAPVGTQLLLTVEPTRNDVAAYVTASGQPQFTALAQIIAALQQADPAAAHAILSSIMPQPNEMLPGALLFFLSAVRQGDVRNWLGNGVLDTLTRMGKAELIGKLAQELQQAAQPSRDNVVGEWRTYQVPIHDNSQFNVLYFHIHGDRQHHNPGQGDGKDDQTKPTQMRFLIDVRMSRLGPMQLDGFLRPRQLDIIVRSENPLPPWLNQDLRQSYSKTMEAIGYVGGLNFQNGRQGWLNIQQSAAGKAITT